MKKSVLLFLFSALILFFFMPVQSHAATTQTKIILDGQELNLPNEVEVVNVRNNIMIPIRVVAENLEFNVIWDQKTQNVNIQQGSKTITLTVGKQEASVDNSTVSLNIAPQIIKNTVVVPIRFVSEEMGLKVGWNNQEKIVTLASTPTTSPPSSSANSSQNDATTNLVHEINYANNQLVVSLDREVTPVITTLKNPDRIVVDFPSTNFGNLSQPAPTGSMGKLSTGDIPNLTEVRYSLFKNDPAQVRIVIELNNVSSVSYNQQYIDGKFILDLIMVNDPTPATPISDSGKKVVVIDPGHGGSDPGTTSITNKHEKDFNLALALKVQAILLQEPEIEVVMTRETDVYPTRSERVKLANDLNADVFVSIHGNSVLSSPQTTGTETFYYQRASSEELANIVHKHLVEAMGLKDRGVKNGSLQVIRETTMPAVLLEVGFLSNLPEEEAMMSESVQTKAAQAIVDGIKEYLKL
ncbi:N-acetylmuramoyl-L-alanine amidase family protein [Paenibacillus wynnii]|uniref:N-acetylmuramoyl-L-alanine amidase family protein n=1 Tax=Paenibacillus wynnii TaxID=268407 RepID=UPI002791EB1B|nr:N-acetylmuramoyl-L-alanine amidase family protein [Paenibacillus wynnii]MDQ0196338.1 N-acetylmuramoyl-L-alanine amidase [Paenibacillus wynnii]